MCFLFARATAALDLSHDANLGVARKQVKRDVSLFKTAAATLQLSVDTGRCLRDRAVALPQRVRGVVVVERRLVDQQVLPCSEDAGSKGVSDGPGRETETSETKQRKSQ